MDKRWFDLSHKRTHAYFTLLVIDQNVLKSIYSMNQAVIPWVGNLIKEKSCISTSAWIFH
jgi:hypothetical protein